VSVEVARRIPTPDELRKVLRLAEDARYEVDMEMALHLGSIVKAHELARRVREVLRQKLGLRCGYRIDRERDVFTDKSIKSFSFPDGSAVAIGYVIATDEVPCEVDGRRVPLVLVDMWRVEVVVSRGGKYVRYWLPVKIDVYVSEVSIRDTLEKKS
jgi:hypothetical protein